MTAAVDGPWDVHVKGPGIDDTFRVTLRHAGDEVTGEVHDGADRIPITGGRLTGDTLTFAMSVTEPMRAKLSAKLVVDGDRMTGSARANLLLKVALDATRAS